MIEAHRIFLFPNLICSDEEARSVVMFRLSFFTYLILFNDSLTLIWLFYSYYGYYGIYRIMVISDYTNACVFCVHMHRNIRYRKKYDLLISN